VCRIFHVQLLLLLLLMFDGGNDMFHFSSDSLSERVVFFQIERGSFLP
jgi:hypothetical protein